MGIFGKKSDPVSGHTPVGLTELGKKTAEGALSRGGTFAILSALAERSPQSVLDISNATGMDLGETKERCKILARQGYVRLVGGGEPV